MLKNMLGIQCIDLGWDKQLCLSKTHIASTYLHSVGKFDETMDYFRAIERKPIFFNNGASNGAFIYS
jgi:hypothetical protein